MQKHLLYILTIAHLLISAFASASLPSARLPDGQVLAGFQNRPIHFTENKGQITDKDGKQVPFVLFSAEAPGMNMYITEKGLTYIFNKVEKESDDINKKKDDGLSKSINPFAKHKSDKLKKVVWNRIDMALAGASIKAENIIKEGMSTDFSRYFLAHCPEGIIDVRSYEKITIKEIYPGIDWVLYTNENDFPLGEGQTGAKYDFIVHPGANPKQIELVYSSLLPLELDKTGNINLQTKIGTLSENAPYSYISTSLAEGKKNSQEIASQFQITNQKHIIPKIGDAYYQTTIGFNLGSYVLPIGSTLIIDPQLFWVTFYGGVNADGPMSLATDATGNVFVTGYTGSPNFPQQVGGITTYQGVFGGAGTDAFVMKFSNSGALLWSTFYGGIDQDFAHSIAIDLNGNVFVTGKTASINFPLYNAETFFQGVVNGGEDAFILKFDNAGNRLWATCYGGLNNDIGIAITTDGNGNVYVTGETASTDFPLQNAGTFFQPAYGNGTFDAFILKFDNAGNRLWATYYGASREDNPNSIATDANGNVFITGYTGSTNFPLQNSGTYFQGTYGSNGVWSHAFILKFDKLGNRLWATYYAGNDADAGRSIAVDRSGNVFVCGATVSTNFPVQDAGTFFQGNNAGAADNFLLKFDNVGNRLWATYYGGSLGEPFASGDLAIDTCGIVYMGFATSSNDVLTKTPCDGGYVDNTFNGVSDQFITRFSNTGELLWATYLGGNDQDFRSPMALDKSGNLFVSGEWNNFGASTPASYPLTNPGGGAYFNNLNSGSDDGFMVKFNKIPLVTNIVANADCKCTSTATATATGGCAPYVYLWSDGQTTQTATSLCAGNYTVIVRDTISCSTSTANVTITPVPTPTSSFTVTSPVCIGANSTITYTGNAIAAAIYTWDFDNGNITSGIGQGPFTVNWTTSGTKNITLTVTQAGCASVLFTQTVTVSPPDNALFNYSTGTFCQTGTNPTPSITGIPGGVFTSSPAGLTFVSTATGEINLASSSLNTYTISYATPGPCPNSSSVSITVTNTPKATFNYSGPYCQNAANPSPVFSGGGSAGIFSSTSGLVFVNTGTGQINLAASTPGTYTVSNNIVATGGCVAASATASITITSLPVATFNYTGSPFCQNATNPSPTFIGNGAAGTFTSTSGLVFVSASSGQLDLTTSSPGTYTVTNTFTASGGCPAVAATDGITITPLQDAGFNYSSSIFCKSESNPFPIINSVAGGVFTSLPAGLIFVNSSTGEIDLSSTAINTYSITYTTPGPCPNTNSVTVDVTIDAIITLTSAAGTDVQTLCINSPIIPITYSISGGVTGAIVSGLPAGITGSYAGGIVAISGTPLTAGVFNYTVNATGTCVPKVVSGSLTINQIQVTPTVSSNSPVCEGFSLDLTTSTINGASYLWTGPNSYSSDLQNPSILLAKTILNGTYKVATIVAGCTFKDSVEVLVVNCDDVPGEIVPLEAFSPNADGINDVFIPFTRNLISYHLQIFNRWGEKIFETTDPQIGWDAKNEDSLLQQNVYVYIIQAIGKDDKKIYLNGSILLLK